MNSGKVNRRIFLVGILAAVCAMFVWLACQRRPTQPAESRADHAPAVSGSLPVSTRQSAAGESDAQLLRQVESAVSRSVSAPMEPLLELESGGPPIGDIR